MPYSPIFGKVDDISGNVYPMLGELGDGYGSVELNYEFPHTQTTKLKCYPKLVHYLKARNIGVDLPTTVKGYRSRVGALEQMLLEFNTDPGRYLCGFCFELAISGTLLSLMQCYDQVRTYRIDDEGVPENVIVMKRIPVDEYITFLTNALGDAKDAGLCHGRTSSTPSDVQKALMAEVMNAAGYCSTKWLGYCCTKEEKKIEQIRVKEDEDQRDELTKDILKRLYTRKSARNARLVCAVTRTGGCTKSFPSCIGLARYLTDEYGEHWYRK